MWLRRLAPLSLASALVLLAACETDDDAACASVQESYRVSVALSVAESVDTQAKIASSEDPLGRVLVTVSEDRSIVFCGTAGLVSEQTPGNDLLSSVPVQVDETGFSLSVDSTMYPELGDAPGLWLDVLLDENDNGHCDDNELGGTSAMPRAGQASLSVVLTRRPCPYRL